MQTLYEILEVSEKASKEVIEKAYKVLAKKYHPDLQTAETKQKAEEKMKQINDAYSVLSDDVKRKEYDQELAQKRNYERVQQEKKYEQNAYERRMEETFQQNNVNNVEHNDKNFSREQENIIKQKIEQDLQQQYEARYQNAYENYLRSLGYRIKYKWTWKNYRDLLITIGIMILIGLLIYIFPPTRKILIDFYEENVVFKTIVDIIKNIFIGIWNAIISLF